MKGAGRIIDEVQVLCTRAANHSSGQELVVREYHRMTGTPDSSGSWVSGLTLAEQENAMAELAKLGDDVPPTEQQMTAALSSPSSRCSPKPTRASQSRRCRRGPAFRVRVSAG